LRKEAFVMSDKLREIYARLARPAVAFIVLGVVASATLRADDQERRLLVAQHDEVQAFDVATGKGFQTGTTTGLVLGTSYVNFQFTIVGPPGADGALPITFKNKVLITDLDGDQLFFDNNGTGRFHVGIPGDTFVGTGGPLTGSYVLTGGTGKFAKWNVGSTYDYRAIATNPPNGALGNVHAQVTFHDHDPK
jgi:hypothetical protein